jgi:hypothetical protein
MFPVSMMQQRDRLFRALGHIVAKVDDLDVLVPFLQQLGRDHRKFGALAAHYPAVGASLLATLEQYAGEDWTPELAADWAAAYGVVADVMVTAAQEADDEPPWWDAEVVSHERRGSDLARAARADRPAARLRAGSVGDRDDRAAPRGCGAPTRSRTPRRRTASSSCTSAPVTAGPVSGALVRHTSVGSVLRLGPPLGLMVLDPGSDRDLLLVGIGTGMAPLKALVEQVSRLEVPRRVDFFVGARSPDGFYDLPALRELEQEHPWLHVVLVAHPGRPAGCGGARRHGGRRPAARAVDQPGRLPQWRTPGRAGAQGALVRTRVPDRRIKVEEFTPSSWSASEAEGAQSA